MKNFLDGELIWQYTHLSAPEKTQLAKQIGTEVEQVGPVSTRAHTHTHTCTHTHTHIRTHTQTRTHTHTHIRTHTQTRTHTHAFTHTLHTHTHTHTQTRTHTHAFTHNIFIHGLFYCLLLQIQTDLSAVMKDTCHF